MSRTNLIRALGLYVILAVGAWLTLEDARFRAITLIVVSGLALKTVGAWARER
jgi:hypothetical protein